MGDGRVYGAPDALCSVVRAAAAAARGAMNRPGAATAAALPPSCQSGLEMHLGLFLVKWPFRFRFLRWWPPDRVTHSLRRKGLVL